MKNYNQRQDLGVTLFQINWLTPQANPSVKFSRVIYLVAWVKISAN